MATQSGGQAAAQSGVVYDTNDAVVQSFFSNPILGTINLDTEQQVRPGIDTYTTSTGATVTMVGSGFTDPVLQLQNSGPQPPVVGGEGAAPSNAIWGQVIVGTNTDTTLAGSGGANNVFITDAAFHNVKGAGGDDVVQSAGTGGGNFYGGAGKDLLISGGGKTLLDGGAGNDTLIGGSGADRLSGGTGNDLLVAGTGDEVLTGGLGRDTFVFGQHETGTPYQDHITDFHKGDVLDLSARAGQFNLVQTGKDAVFQFSNGDQIILHNVKVSKLHDDGDDGIFSL